MSWHVLVAIMKTADGRFRTRTIIHCFAQCKQDSNAVLAVLEDALLRLKSEIPTLSEVWLRSDNGGCYHSASTILSLPVISASTNVTIRRMDFSDPQGGKADCDRMAATVKRHVRLYVNEKHDCSNPKQFVEAVEARGGIGGVSIHNGALKPRGDTGQHQPLKKKVQLKGVSLLNNFEFGDNGIRAWKAYGIGQGQIIGKPAGAYNKQKFEEETGTSQPVQWRIIGDTKNKETDQIPSSDEEEMDEETIMDQLTESKEKLFECPEDGCIKAYRYSAHLDHHLSIRKHEFEATKESLTDFAMRSYKKQLEDPTRANIYVEASTGSERLVSEKPLPRGWALQQRKKAAPFSAKQLRFLMEKFNKGEQTSMKYTPEQVAASMRTEKDSDGRPLFSKAEFLTRNQIASKFSQLAARKGLEENEPMPENGSEDNEKSEGDLSEEESEALETDYQSNIENIHKVVRHRLENQDQVAELNIASTSASDIASTSGLRRLTRIAKKRKLSPQ